MKIERLDRENGFWITPLIAGHKSEGRFALYFAWIVWLWKIDFSS